MKTSFNAKGLLTSVLLLVMAAPAMASDSLNYKRLQRSGSDHIRGTQRVEYTDRRHTKREHHKRRDNHYDGDRRNHRYDRHRSNRHHAKRNHRYDRHRSNRHHARHYRQHNHRDSYRRYPLSSYSLYYNVSPYYSFGFRYYD